MSTFFTSCVGWKCSWLLSYCNQQILEVLSLCHWWSGYSTFHMCMTNVQLCLLQSWNSSHHTQPGCPFLTCCPLLLAFLHRRLWCLHHHDCFWGHTLVWYWYWMAFLIVREWPVCQIQVRSPESSISCHCEQNQLLLHACYHLCCRKTCGQCPSTFHPHQSSVSHWALWHARCTWEFNASVQLVSQWHTRFVHSMYQYMSCVLQVTSCYAFFVLM